MRIERHPRDHVPGIVIALAAGLHKAILTSTPVNDDYQHLAFARQLFHGDLPLRDFWDLSTTLQEVVSAASQLVFGNRLLAEAVVIGVDRKSTRLNSSHSQISYAVFCLKKKKDPPYY